tara:strand:+ start:562 stop:789 length:228 start_codon:yes stop_codon:yes gene_type:complete
MNQIINDINQIVDVNKLVAILELTVYKLEIDTISEMARKEGKSPNGINKSNCYRKLKVGKQKFAIKGIRDTNLPF